MESVAACFRKPLPDQYNLFMTIFDNDFAS